MSEVHRGIVKVVGGKGKFAINSKIPNYLYTCEAATHDYLKTGDRVLCAFVENSDWDVVILGKIRTPNTTESFELHSAHVNDDHPHDHPHSH